MTDSLRCFITSSDCMFTLSRSGEWYAYSFSNTCGRYHANPHSGYSCTRPNSRQLLLLQLLSSLLRSEPNDSTTDSGSGGSRLRSACRRLRLEAGLTWLGGVAQVDLLVDSGRWEAYQPPSQRGPGEAVHVQ